MYPFIFGQHSIYSLMFPLMVLIAASYLVYKLRAEQQPLKNILITLGLLAVLMLLGSKLFSLASRGWPQDWLSVYELTSGWRFSGCVLGLAALPFIGKKFLPGLSPFRLGDIMAMALVLGMCFGRFICFLAGCCTGAIGEGFLHMRYPPGSAVWYQHLHAGVIPNSSSLSEPVLALPLLFLPASFIAAGLMFWWDKRRQYDGQILLLFLLAHELPKAGLELLRDPFIIEQFYATLLAGSFGLIALAYFYLSPPKQRV